MHEKHLIHPNLCKIQSFPDSDVDQTKGERADRMATRVDEDGFGRTGGGAKVVILDSEATVRAIFTPRRLNILLHMHEQGCTVRRDAVY